MSENTEQTIQDITVMLDQLIADCKKEKYHDVAKKLEEVKGVYLAVTFNLLLKLGIKELAKENPEWEKTKVKFTS